MQGLGKPGTNIWSTGQGAPCNTDFNFPGYSEGGISGDVDNTAAGFRWVYRMFAIYTLSGIVGFWISYLAGVYLTIGASASVCGLVGAILYYSKSRGGVYGKHLYRQIAVWVVFLFIFGMVVPGINNWGDGGGILAGIIFGYLLGYQEKKRENFFHRTLAGLCLIGTLGVLIWAVSTAVYYLLLG